MVMGMFMDCGPRDSKSYPFESQFKRVVLHESTRSMHDTGRIRNQRHLKFRHIKPLSLFTCISSKF